jgi:hypothetical protein
VNPRPDPNSEEAGGSEYGNDTGFAEEATRQPDGSGTGPEPAGPGPDEAPTTPGEPPD